MEELNVFLSSLDPRERDRAKVELARICNLSLYTIESYRRSVRQPKVTTYNIITEFMKTYKKRK